MMIGITGEICSGKSTLASFLVKNFEFEAINLNELLLQKLELSEENKKNPSLILSILYSNDFASTRECIIETIMEHLSNNRSKKFVIFPLNNSIDIEKLSRFKQFFTVGIECPLLIRYEFFTKKYSKFDLQKFVELDDNSNYGISFNSDIRKCLSNCKKIFSYKRPEEFFDQIKSFSWTNYELIRPNWDTYFISLCELSSQRSNCIRRSIGAVLVKNLRIISTGYNGAPFGAKNCFEGGCPRCYSDVKSGKNLEECICIHAEENALLEAGRSKALGSTLYTSYFQIGRAHV